MMPMPVWFPLIVLFVISIVPELKLLLLRERVRGIYQFLMNHRIKVEPVPIASGGRQAITMR
jgi:hypothetical protein